MSNIERHQVGQRMSQIVKHGDTIYLAGQVGTPGDSVAGQTQECLNKIDALLTEVGSDKSCILQTIIWLADMREFQEMNSVWDEWVPEGHAPVRACGEAILASPHLRVEFIVTAAVK